MADDTGADTSTTEKLPTDTTTADTIVNAADTTTTDTTKTETTTTAPDWRAQMAGDDKEAMKRLARFTDPGQVFKSFRSLEQKISSGEYRKPLEENATPEQRAEWRKANGLPEKPEAYVEGLALPNGLVIGEAEKPIVAELAGVALEGNIDPKAFNGIVAKYYELQDQARQKQEDADVAFKLESEDALRKDWQGADYRRNLTAVNNLIATWPEDLATNLLAARDPNGRKLGDNPVLIRQLATIAMELNPAATLVPSGTTDAGKSIQARLEEIRTLRRNDPNAYEADKKMQAEELELLDADLKMKSRGKAA